MSGTSAVPVRLAAVQLNLATTHLHLGLSRYQSAWLSFGTAARCSLLLGLHRASPPGTAPDIDARYRRVFHSALMMDRFLSIVLGLPAFYNESDISQPYPEVAEAASPQASSADKMLPGSIAHFKLARIMYNAYTDSLRSPKDITPADRQVRIGIVEHALANWRQETPSFFHPTAEETSEAFIQIPPIFQRQQWRVKSTYHFIHLLLYRSYLLDELLARLRRESASTSNPQPSTEIQICIAETAAAMHGKSLSGGTFWNTAHFAFSSITALLVYLMLYDEAPDRVAVEAVVERALRVKDDGGPSGTALLQETRRVASLLRPAPPAAAFPEPTLVHHLDGGVPGPGEGLEELFLPALFTDNSFTGDGAGMTGQWEDLLADLQGLVQSGFDTYPVQHFPPTF
ncbi:hypothetical protein JCM10207_000756 [Rhodosporidiobolus poonsookiae]